MNKRKFKKSLFREVWVTPVTQVHLLWLDSVLQTLNKVHLFLSTESGKDVFVVSFERLSPYRLVDEAYAYGYLAHYKRRDRDTKSKKISGRIRTWKVWGTPFIQELDQNHVLSKYEKKKDKTIFEYVIATEDEWIEIISEEAPTWKKYKNIKIKTLISRYLKEADFS